MAARDDLKVHPENEKGLLLLDEAEKKQFNLEGVPTNLAYRSEDAHPKLSLVVERTEPRITARTFSFVRVEPGALFVAWKGRRADGAAARALLACRTHAHEAGTRRLRPFG